jgi:TonB family protein
MQTIRLQAYQERIRELIIDAWILPLSEGTARTLQATALLTINRQGEVMRFELLQPSGNKQFDESLLRAMKKASPLPALPEDFSGPLLEVEIHFQPRDS